MKNKLAAILIAVLMCIGLAACGNADNRKTDDVDDNPPTITTPVDPDLDNPEPVTPVNPAVPDEDDESFFVRLYQIDDNNSKKYVSFGTGVQARWTQVDRNGTIISIPVSANFDTTGIAKMDGLDGNYRVTLINLPSGYAYDPNIYQASNSDRGVDIEVFRLNSTLSDGSDWYVNRINIQKAGAFSVTVKSANDMIRFSYQPGSNGIYHIESFNDIYTNEVNPIIEMYNGSGAFVNEAYPLQTINTGSTYASFTKNFMYNYYLTPEADRNVLLFGIKAESKISYPVQVQFRVWYEAPYSAPENEVIYPHEFDDVLPAGSNTDNFELVDMNEVNELKNKYSGSELIEKLIEYHHVTTSYEQSPSGKNEYNNWFKDAADKKSYANVLMQAYGTTILRCDNANFFSAKVFKYNNDTGYYHMWDEETGEYGAIICATITKDAFAFSTETGAAFMDDKISCNYVNNKNYTEFICSYYANYVNSAGLYPVTQELQEFLQGFASSRGYFADGDGWLESEGWSAADGAMWLFACGYYS